MYVVNERAGGQTHTIISLADGNTIKCGSSTLTLDKGETGTCTPSWGSSINATKPFYADVAVDAASPPVPATFAGRTFIYRSDRGTNRFSVYALEGDAHVEVYNGGSLAASADIPRGSVTTISQDIPNGNTVRIESNVSVLVSHYTTNPEDGYNFYPAGREWYGTPSTCLEIGAGPTATHVDVYYSDGSTASWDLAADGNVVVTGLSSQGAAKGAYVVASASIGVNQLADGDGSEASTFLPVKEFDDEFYIPLAGQYVALVSDRSFSCSLNGGTPSSASGGPSPYPYKLKLGSVSAGTRINCSAAVQAYYEQSTNDQETNLWGAKQFRRYSSTEPAVAVGSETAGGTLVGVIPGIKKGSSFGIGANATTAFAFINGQVISSALSPGWNHIALTYDRTAGSNQQRLYINGVLAAQGTLSDPISSSTSDLLIGSLFSGIMDEVHLYNSVLNATEIGLLYNGSYSDTSDLIGNWELDEGSGTSADDVSGHDLHGTLSGPSWSSETAPFGGMKQGTTSSGIASFTLRIPSDYTGYTITASAASDRYGQTRTGDSSAMVYVGNLVIFPERAEYMVGDPSWAESPDVDRVPEDFRQMFVDVALLNSRGHPVRSMAPAVEVISPTGDKLMTLVLRDHQILEDFEDLTNVALGNATSGDSATMSRSANHAIGRYSAKVDYTLQAGPETWAYADLRINVSSLPGGYDGLALYVYSSQYNYYSRLKLGP
jgi:hypothetical protein